MNKKFALIIANTEYTDPRLAQLITPGKDAEDFARVLQSKDICNFDHVQISLNQPSSSVIDAIDEFFDEKKPDDLLVLYFSGHGIRDEIGSLYLAFKNTIRSRLRSTAIKSDYIREAMDQSRSKRQVLILDCCNSGAFPQGTKAELGGVMGMTIAFQGSGRFVLTASDATQFAWEGDKVIGETDNSLFTHFLVKGLEGEADSDSDGRITVDEIYDYIFQQISKVTPKQIPTKSATKQEGELVLRQNMRIEDIKPIPLSDDLINEIDDTRPFVRENAVHTLEKIIKGKNIGLARSAREALEKIITDENTTRRVAQAATQVLDSILQLERGAEEERRVREEAERLTMLKTIDERLAREKAEAVRKTEEDAEILARSQAEREDAERETSRLKAERQVARRDAIKKLLPKLVPFLRIIGIFGIIIILFWAGSWAIPQFISLIPTANATATQPPVVKITSTSSPVVPTKTATPAATSTKTQTPTPVAITDAKGVSMVNVPAGEFMMGSTSEQVDQAYTDCQKQKNNHNQCPPDIFDNEMPQHKVYLDPYNIDQYEVTNARYADCVTAGVCQPPGRIIYNRDSYYGDVEFDNYPVINVSWSDASTYCQWRGARLPTEAEWEKAASWNDVTQEKYVYPWGNDFDGSLVNFCDVNCTSDWADKNSNDGYLDTAPVGNYSNGVSPYGVYNMAGNVWEWVNDWYQSDYYATLGDNASNPQGPSNGDTRVLRGGSWYFNDFNVRSADRYGHVPTVEYDNLGFRCARSLP